MAVRIFKLIDQHHWMLVTLLLSTTLALEALPLYLDKIVSSELSVLFSVVLVLIFGEIIPQAVCTGRN